MSVRSFVSVPLNVLVRKGIQKWQKELRKQLGSDYRWVNPANFHITLSFLGDVKVGILPEIRSSLQRSVAGFSQFRIVFGLAGAFPSENNARVLWAGISEGANDLKNLQQRVADVLQREHDFARERRDYHPHVTLGRARNRRGSSRNVSHVLSKAREKEFGEETVDRIQLMKSELHPGGPVYEVLADMYLSDC